MSWAARCLIGAVSVSLPSVVSAQQQAAIQLGLKNSVSESIHAPPFAQPSALAVGLKSEWRAISGAIVGFSVGFLIDGIYCKQHHGDEEGFIFGPCAFYVSYASALGWFGGSVAGATAAAAHQARKRGCRRETAIWRALAGATAGVIPGLIVVSGRPGKYPPSRSVFIFTAPLLAGAGGAAAVLGCHS